MKRKFSLFVTIVVCLLIVVGILSACNEGEKKIASIDFADGEWQTNYYLGEVFEPCVATVTYEDGSTETVAVTPEMVKGFDTSKLGNYNIEITINGVTKVMTITVVEKGEEAHVHSMELTAAKEATCTEGGNNAYYHCSGCNKYFKDEAGTQETTVEAETIPAAGHVIVDGVCTACGELSYTEGLEYTLSSDKTYYIVTGIGTASGDIIIPDTHEGLPVTYIGSYAFQNCSSLTSIEIPAGVTSIENYAFSGCSNLESVTFGEGSQLTSIGDGAFYGCSSLTSIEIPTGVTELSVSNSNVVNYGVFSECSNLESVTFAERSGLTSIGGYAFYNCSSLTSIEIPAGVTSIGDYAFSRCSNLENVTFAEGSLLTSIGDYAFWYCSNLDTVYYAGSIENWFNIDFYDFFSNPLRNGADLYIGGELVTAVVVPESITTIGYQLTGCTSLTSITIHSGVTSIGSEAFRYCSNLESVTFAEGSQLTSIGDYAFYFCSNLTSIEILSGVTSIGSDAFDGCYLTIVYNYSDLEITAGSSDHGGVAQYAEVVLTEDNLGNVKDENGYVTYTDGEEVLLLGYLGSEKDIVIPEGVTRIAEYTFDENDIVSVTLPESLTAIGNSAFSGCHNLKEVYNNSSLNITAGSSGYGYVAYYAVKVHNSSESESIFDDESGFAIVDGVLYGYRGSATNIIIPETVTSIANYAFYGNTDIISVTIPTGVTSIGDYAFRDCSSLKSIEIHAGVTSIGSWAFQYCSNLNTVYYAGSIEDWLNIEFGGYNSNPLNYGADLYIGGELVTEVVVPESITTIDTQLIGCTSLTSITIHSGVTSIGRSAFSGCSNLVSVIFAEGSQLTSIGDGAFYGCSSLTSIEIPTGVTELSVSNSNVINAGVFSECSNLESVTFAEGSQLTSIGGMVFYGCSSLQSIEIPAGVTSIGRSAFYNCSNLESVTFAEGSQLTSIGSSAFQDCISLKSIEIPAGVTSIGDWAFYVCSSLTSIEIPVGVTSIGGYAFYDCSNLNTVYYSGSIEDWLNIEFGSSSSNPLYYGADLYIGGELVTEVVVPESITTIATQLRGCTSLTSITIHSGVTSIGDWAFSGCSNLTSIEIPAGVTSIGDYAFYYCSGLTSINIPAGVTSIGDYAFYHCSNLETIYYNGTEEQWNAIGKGSYWDSNCGNYEVVFLGDAGAEGGEG